MKKRTITINETVYNVIKEYCNENGLKIGGFTEKILLNYIKNINKQ
jgi:hypothetical protein